MTNRPTQQEMKDKTAHQLHDGMHTFVEIMNGSNPLTKEEIKKLHAKNPQWSWLSKWY